MPLSPPAAREPIHHRRIDCRGYRRADGLWDIEGHLTDTKNYAFENEWRGTVDPGVPIHDMWIRMTVDDRMTIVAIEAVTDHSPYAICQSVGPVFQKLVGLKLRAGFNQKVRELVGGVAGCTHLVDMMGPVATTAFQTIFPIRARERGVAGAARDDSDTARPPRLLNTCKAFAADGALVKAYWPDHYNGPDRAAE